MNQARLAQLAALIVTVTVGPVVFSIFNPKPTTEHADLVDAGAVSANRVATCPVRVSPECVARYGVKSYETLRFPVYREALPDGGVIILMPAASKATDGKLLDCVRVKSWQDCDLDPVGTFPAVASRWGNANPFVLARTASKFVIPNCKLPDGGFDHNHAPVDCQPRDAGWRGCSVMLRAEAAGAECLDAPTGVVDYGTRLEDNL